MARILCVIPHSHSWFWLQTCIACLHMNPPRANGFKTHIIVVDNSPWSPAIRGITDTAFDSMDIEILPNPKSNKFHASALDCVVERYDFDYLMALETDVMVLRPDWLQWFVDQMQPTDYAVGMWHHERFINPSCTLYRDSALYEMQQWCQTKAPQDELRWSLDFSLSAPLDNNLPLSENPAAVLDNLKGWIAGPFAEKRGWPEGTQLPEQPSGQLKGPGWYEPGQQLHHWAVAKKYTYTVCPSITTHVNGCPLQSLYGTERNPRRQLEAYELFASGAYTAHLWGGTRALDILKHPVTCEFVKANTSIWLAREARFWKKVVPRDIQAATIDLIRRYGWHYRGQGTPDVTDRDREAAAYVQRCYEAGGVSI